MKDAELSLAVAKIMWPESFWQINDGKTHAFTMSGGLCVVKFDHTTDDSLGKMCVWLGKLPRSTIATFDRGMTSLDYGLYHVLAADNPHRSIAEAIVDTA